MTPANDILNRIATDNLSKQISASWVYLTDATTDQILQEFALQGQSFFQASGDSDAYVGAIVGSEEDANMTLVGGTQLTMNGNGISYSSEEVWQQGYGGPPGGAPQYNSYWGTGGGVSTDIPIPVWQQGINMANNGGSTAFRNIPDVALTAFNIWVVAGDQTQDGDYEGTSCAAPLWNGFTALVNQQGVNNGEAPQGFINPAVYAIGKSVNYANCFHDIVVGNNEWPSSPTEFSAVPGYDLCTGLGTPNGSNMINALAPIVDVPVFAVVTNIISGGNGNGIIDFNECNDLTIILSNLTSISATGVEAALTSSTTGAIVAQGTASYPALFPHSSAANLSAFTLSTEPNFVCGTPINLTLVIKCNPGDSNQPDSACLGCAGFAGQFYQCDRLCHPRQHTYTDQFAHFRFEICRPLAN